MSTLRRTPGHGDAGGKEKREWQEGGRKPSKIMKKDERVTPCCFFHHDTFFQSIVFQWTSTQKREG